MKAFILAAGFGKRLKELTKNTPKPLVKVDDIPLIVFVLHLLKKAGITDIIINLHYKGEQIENFLGNGNSCGLNISYSYEKDILGTAGGIKNVESFFEGEENFLVINSDIISDINLRDIINSHLDSASIATLGVKEGVKKDFYYDNSNKLLSIINPSENCKYGVFTGIQVLNREFFNYSEIKYSSSIDVYKRYIDEGKKISVYPLNSSFWYDFGIIEKNSFFLKELKESNNTFLDEVRNSFADILR